MVRTYALALVCWLPFAAAWGAEIEVRSDRNPVALNESFELVYQSADEVDGDPDFSVLEEQLDILNRSQSNNISIINGKYSRSHNWKLTVMARREGKLELPPVPFGSDLSQSLSIQVNAAQQLDAGTESFHTRVRLSSASGYVQQQLIVTQQLFTPYSLSAYGFGDLQFGGVDVVVEPLGEEKQYRTRIGDQPYIVIEKRFAVFPQGEGVLTLAPALVEGQTGSRSGSLFDPFPSRGRVLRARSAEKRIEVIPVPATANMNPWLPARELQLLEQWPQDPPQLTVGEPLTRTLSIKAEGLTAAQLPELASGEIDGLKQYPDQALLENIRNDNGISGYRVEKVAFIPTKAGEITLPAIEIPWWNTETGQREVARVAARTIEVVAAPSAAEPAQAIVEASPVAPQTAAQPNTPQQPQDGDASEALPRATEPGYWMWIAIVALLGWLATSVSWWLFSQRRDSVAASDSMSRNDAPKKIMRQLLKACAEGDAHACRSLLIDWGRAEFGEQQIQGLGELAARLPTDLGGLLCELDASLYASGATRPDFNALAEGLKRYSSERAQQQRKRNEQPDLQPLYK